MNPLLTPVNFCRIINNLLQKIEIYSYFFFDLLTEIIFCIKLVHKLLKMFEIFLSLMIGLTIFAWYEIVKKREIAIEASKRIANNFNLQLLDDSVSCSSFKIIKTSS